MNLVEQNRTKFFRFDRAGSMAQNAPLKIRIAFCNSDSSNVNAPSAFTSLRFPGWRKHFPRSGQEHFTRFSRLRADYIGEVLRERNGTRRGKLRRQEIEIYYSFVGKVELPES